MEGHGFSPFDLVHGFGQRTPLEALYHNLVESQGSQLAVSEWVERMADNLYSIREAAALDAAKTLDQSRLYIDIGESSRYPPSTRIHQETKSAQRLPIHTER